MGRNTLTRAVVGTLAAGALVFTTAGACGGTQEAPAPAPTQQQQGGDQGGDDAEDDANQGRPGAGEDDGDDN